METIENTDRDPNRIAFHEAGHAVAGFVFLMPMKEVSILEDARGIGRCDCVDTGSMTGNMILSFAGEQTEWFFFGSGHMSEGDRRGADDRANEIYGMTPSRKLRFFEECRAIARQLVCKYEDIIRAFAAVLLKERILKGERANEILKSNFSEEEGRKNRESWMDQLRHWLTRNP